MDSYRVSLKSLESLLIALSILVYAFRGKYGAVIITAALIFVVICNLRNFKIRPCSLSFYLAAYFFIFAFLLNIVRTINKEYYLMIGYLFSLFVLINNQFNRYDNLWKWLKAIAITEACGVYMQMFLPNLYYFIIKKILPMDVVSNIQSRVISGYYTGFSREVSYTMFLICIGIGSYWYDFQDNSGDDLTRRSIINKLIICLLLGALLLAGKRATLVFSVFALFIIGFINSEDRFKILKYLMISITGMFLLIVSYPLWKKISTLQRFVTLINFVRSGNMVGMTNGRTVIYQDAVSMWLKRTWTGIGWGNFKYSASRELWYNGFDVHNCFLQILCENGIIGAIPYYILTICIIVNLVRCLMKTRYAETKLNKMAACLGYVQVFFIMYSFTEPILFEYTDYIIYFMCINLTDLLLKRIKTNSLQSPLEKKFEKVFS